MYYYLFGYFSTVKPCKMSPSKGALYSTFPWSLSVFHVTLPQWSVKSSHSVSFSHYLPRPAVFLCPVVFPILFIQLNLRPRPSHLPAAVMWSNWLVGWFARHPPATCQSMEQLLVQWMPGGASVSTLWKSSKNCANPSPWGAGCWSYSVTSTTSFQSYLCCSCGSSWLSSGTRTKRATLLCFVLCTSACRESSLAQVPVP